MENLKPIIINYISDKFVKKNQNAYFEVEYYTEADFFEIIWYFKGKKLDDIERNRKYVIENESRITRIQIFDVNEDDCGEYECKIKNMYGESITKGNLLIKRSKKIKRKKYKTKF
jgi:hypothetical protein